MTFASQPTAEHSAFARAIQASLAADPDQRPAPAQPPGAYTFETPDGPFDTALRTLTDPVQVVAAALTMDRRARVFVSPGATPLSDLLADERLVAQARDFNRVFRIGYPSPEAAQAARRGYDARWAAQPEQVAA